MPNNPVVKLLKKSPPLYNLAKWAYTRYSQLLSIRNWRQIQNNTQISLELGSGSKKGKNEWTTVDLFGADINWNLKNGIPLKDACVDKIYMSHMLEHIPYKDIFTLIGECKRILKKGGHLSVCVPDASLYIKAYIEKKNFRESKNYYQPALVDTGSFIDQVNYVAYMGGEHAYMFDSENLINTLKKSGFENACLRHFDSSIDLLERDNGSIYAIAYK